jgi:hypothetical protein
MSQPVADPRYANFLWSVSSNRNIYLLFNQANQWVYQKLGTIWNATWKKKYVLPSGAEVAVFSIRYVPELVAEVSDDVDIEETSSSQVAHQQVILAEAKFTLFGPNVVKGTEHLSHPKVHPELIRTHEKAVAEKKFNASGQWFKGPVAKMWKQTQKEFPNTNSSFGSPTPSSPSTSSSTTAFGPISTSTSCSPQLQPPQQKAVLTEEDKAARMQEMEQFMESTSKFVL